MRAFSGRTTVRMCGMMPAGNTTHRCHATVRTRCFAARCCAALLAAPLTVLGVGFEAMGTAARAPAPQAASQETIALPDAASTVDAFFTVRDWVERFRLPSPDDAEATIRIGGASGVFVQLRTRGRVVGSGIAAAPRAGADSTDAALMVRRAAGRAMSQVLGDPSVRNLPEELTDRVGRSLTLELEVAGPMQPLLGRSFDAISRQLSPGLDGVAMRRGDEWAMLFPARLRATNTAAAVRTRLPGLAAELGLQVTDDLAQLMNEHGVSMYRFRAMHLTQSTPSGAPFETFRGDVVVEQHHVTRESIETFAANLTQRIEKSIWPHDPQSDEPTRRAALGLMGDYHPVSDSYQPLIASPLTQALSAYALLRYSNTPGVDVEHAERAMRAGLTVLDDLSHVEAGQDDPRDDAAACAAIVLALSELPQEHWKDAHRQFADQAISRVGGAFDAHANRFVEQGQLEHSPGFPPHQQALLAAAMARQLKHHARGTGPLRDYPLALEHVHEAIEAAWRSASEAQWVTLLPWIASAELDYADAVERAELMNPERFAELHRMLMQIEAGSEAFPDEPDVHGGLRLAGETRPGSQTVRPASLLAMALADPRLLPDGDQAACRAQAMRVIRFLIQLSVREQAAWSLRHPERAIGGIRLAVWDSRQPAAAQAMALLLSSDLLRALREE